MKFLDLFKEDNSINEKNIIGFISFFIMILFALADIVTSVLSNTELEISTTIYSSFVVVTLGSFGISEAGKYFAAKAKNNSEESSKSPRVEQYPGKHYHERSKPYIRRS